MYVTLSSGFTSATPFPAPECPERPATGPLRRKNQALGTHLFREGDPAHSLYEIASGVFRLTRVLDNGRRQVIAFGFPGDIIGFPNGDCHNTDCEVIVAGEVIVHQRAALEQVEGDPQIRQRLLQAVLRENSAMQDHFMMLARKSAREKVASFLVTLAERTGTPLASCTSCALPMSRTDIADFLGLTVETVSRSLTRLRKENTITLESSQTVLIRDMCALIAAAQIRD